jgi:hypothetical protein
VSKVLSNSFQNLKSEQTYIPEFLVNNRIASEPEFVGFNAFLKSKRVKYTNKKSLLYNLLLAHFKNFSSKFFHFSLAPCLDSGYTHQNLKI